MAPREGTEGKTAADVVKENFPDDAAFSGGDEGDNDADIGGDDTGDDGQQQQQQDDRGGERRAREGQDDQGEPQRRQQDQQPQRQQQQQPQQRTIPTTAEVRPNARGDLVDANGRVIARAGKEARLYQTAFQAGTKSSGSRLQQQYSAQVGDLTGRLKRAVEIGTEIHTELEQYKTREKTITDLGLTSQEHLQAMQFAAEAKQNPQQAIKKMLTMAAANGIDLTQLGLQGGIDAKSLADVLKGTVAEQMKPLQERLNADKTATEARREQDATRKHVTDFFRANPEARQFSQVFTEVYNDPRFANMPLNEVWLRIQLNLANQRRGQRPQNSQQRRPIPNGRGNMNGAGPENTGSGISDIAPASVTESYDAILRRTLKDAGWVNQ